MKKAKGRRKGELESLDWEEGGSRALWVEDEPIVVRPSSSSRRRSDG